MNVKGKDRERPGNAKQSFPSSDAIRELYRSKEALAYFQEQGAVGGKKGGSAGGKKAAAGMTPEQRSARAKKASLAAAAKRQAAKQEPAAPGRESEID